MVRAMSNLTESNEVLTKTNTALTHQLGVLQKAKGSNNLRNPHTGAGVGPPKEMKLCPQCKIEVYHSPSDCFELPANASPRLLAVRNSLMEHDKPQSCSWYKASFP